jgi:hypothetical protein
LIEYTFPEDFEIARDYSIFLNNLIASTYNSAVDAKIFDHKIDFESPQKAKKFVRKLSEWSRDEYQKYFINQKKHGDLYFIAIKNVIRAVLLDYHQFIFEALENIKKGQLTVAYTLLRKPLKENLFILEWIVADSFEFFKRFNFDDSRSYSPLMLQCDKEFLRSIIKNAIHNIEINSFYDPEFIFQLRYDKSKIFSFDQLWNLSTHLVTDRTPIKTETFNLNFVFSNVDDKEKQLSHIYSLLPYLLFYSVDIIEAALSKISHLEKDNLSTRRYFGFLAWIQEYYVEGNLERATEIKALLNELIFSGDLKCKTCGNAFHMDKEQMINICFGSFMQCSACKTMIELP